MKPRSKNEFSIFTWILSLRPWSFPMCFISVTVGTLWASEHGIDWGLYALALAGMVALHGATNLINDYYDVKNNIDVPGAPTTRYRPHPLAFAELGLKQILFFALSLYVLGFAAGLYLLVLRGWPILVIGLAGVILSYCYSSGPAALKYHGLGELAVFLAWGPLAVSGAYYVQTTAFSLPLLLVSVPVGMLVSLVLLANNVRDFDYDKKQGINTAAVLAGVETSKIIYIFMVVLVFISVVLMALLGPLQYWSLLVLLALPLAVNLCRGLYKKIPLDADAQTARLDILFGLLLIISLWLSGF